MNDATRPGSRVPLARWVLANTLGWILGVVLVIALAMIWGSVFPEAQFMVGIGMGAGVGLMQRRALKADLEAPGRWLWASIVGLGSPFIVLDLADLAGVRSSYSLLVCALFGSLLVGAYQSRLLRPRRGRTLWWIPACAVGWGLPVAGMTLAESGRIPGGGDFLSPVLIFFGGPILGVVTGTALQAMPPRSRPG
jgi:hypothetical protein